MRQVTLLSAAAFLLFLSGCFGKDDKKSADPVTVTPATPSADAGDAKTTDAKTTAQPGASTGVTDTKPAVPERYAPVVNVPKTVALADISAPSVETPASAAKTETQTFLPVADATIHLYQDEQIQSVGGRDYLRAKGAEDTAIIRWDLSSIKGREIKSAQLKLLVRSESLRYLALSTVTVPWVEGTSADYAVEPGAANFFSPVGDKSKPWGADETTDFYSVSYGLGGSFWYKTEVEPGDGKWVIADVHPKLVYALANGDAFSLAVYDGSGQTRTNNSFFSREAGKDKAPTLVVELGSKTDATPPSRPGPLSFSTKDMYNGELILRFAPATDDGFINGAFGYEACYSLEPIADFDAATRIERFRLPHYPEADGQFLAILQNLPSGKPVHIAVRAYDAAGNKGPASVATVDMPFYAVRNFAEPAPGMIAAAGKTAAVVNAGGLEVYALPPSVRVDPKTGDAMEHSDTDLRKGNSVWNAADKSVVLFGSRNEIVDFQLSLKAIEGQAQDVNVTVSDLAGSQGTITADKHIKRFAVWCVKSGGMDIPEVCVPLMAPVGIPLAKNNVQDQTALGVWVDIFIPKTAAPGDYKGTITVSTSSGQATIPVSVKVLPVTFPDLPSHTNELNTYSRSCGEDGQRVKELGGAVKVETMIRQLGRWHASAVNILQYGHTGRIAHTYSVPKVEGVGKDAKITDWSQYDSNYDPYYSGRAFTEEAGYYGPGLGMPEPICYLPIFEFWPADLKTQYRFKTTVKAAVFTNKDKIADAIRADHGRNAPPLEIAFTDQYWDTWNAINRQFVLHLKEKNWNTTRFQFYLNNKTNYHTVPNEGTWWILDEPAQFEDYVALNLFAKNLRAVADPVGLENVHLEYRTDVSRMRLIFGLFDHAYDLFVTSGDAFSAAYLMRERRVRFPSEVHCRYGGGIAMTAPIVQLEASLIKNWIFGCDGSMPYYDSFWQKDWDATEWNRDPGNVDQHNIVYPPGPSGANEPLASIRLKIERRAVQDMEYLYMLSSLTNWSRELVRRTVGASIVLEGKVQQRNYEDPGQITFDGVGADAFVILRARAAQTLLNDMDGKQPVYSRPTGKTATAPTLQGAWSKEPISMRKYFEAEKAKADAARREADMHANAKTLKIAGNGQLSDVGISKHDPETSAKGGSVRIEAGHDGEKLSGLLVSFDMSGIPADKTIIKATLVVKSWDGPSSANNRVAVYQMKTAEWNDNSATWKNRSAGQTGSGGDFQIGVDTEPSAAFGLCPKDDGVDVQDPPVRIEIDVTNMVKAMSKTKANAGFFVTGAPDRTIDDGHSTRFQVRTVDNGDGADSPELIVVHE